MMLTNGSRQSCLLSVAEVAWLLGVETSQVCRAIRRGRLPVVRRRRRMLVPMSAVAYLADNGSYMEPPVELDVRGGA